MNATGEPGDVVDDYLELGLALGRHVDGLVDAYYGPPALASRVAAEPPRPPGQLVDQARALLAALHGGAALSDDGGDDAPRRGWLAAQVRGLLTTARRLAGEDVAYEDEVQECYGVRPRPVPEDDLRQAHLRLAEVLPGKGPLPERLIAWREAHAVSPEVLPGAIASLADDLRERTQRAFGLPRASTWTSSS